MGGTHPIGMHHYSAPANVKATKSRNWMIINVIRPITRSLLQLFSLNSAFSQTHKIDNVVNIANFVLSYICSFLLCLYHTMFVNVKLDISGCHNSTFQVCRLHWFSSFPMAQPKQNCQCWHSSIVKSL